MRIRLPGSFQNWLERRNARAKTERLMTTIAEVNGLMQDKTGSISALAREHVERAEERYKIALKGYEEDRLSECHEQTEFALFRLGLAKDHLTQDDEGKFDPEFEEGTGEYALVALSDALVETKMAIEYSNCVVSEVNRKNLVGVVTMFHDCIEMLKDQQYGMAKRTAEGALLMLYLLEREIELDNRQSIVQLKAIPKLTVKGTRRMKELVDRIALAKTAFRDSPFAPSTRVLKHVDSAVDNFYNSVQAFVDENVDQADKLCATATMQCEFAQRLFRGDNNGRTRSGTDSKATQEFFDRELSKFQSRAQKLQKLAAMKEGFADPVNEHLRIAQEAYEQAQIEYTHANFLQSQEFISRAGAELKQVRELILPTYEKDYGSNS